jgi:hypothetical protein
MNNVHDTLRIDISCTKLSAPVDVRKRFFSMHFIATVSRMPLAVGANETAR